MTAKAADEKIQMEADGETEDGDKAEQKDEATLKTEIKELEKKITNKQAHIDRLQTELQELKEEQRQLKIQRVNLLQSELEN